MSNDDSDPDNPLSVLIARLFIITGLALLVGVLGHAYFGGFSWLDSFYNSSLILTGVGPPIYNVGASLKIFQSIYALFSGILFVLIIGIIVARITDII